MAESQCTVSSVSPAYVRSEIPENLCRCDSSSLNDEYHSCINRPLGWEPLYQRVTTSQPKSNHCIKETRDTFGLTHEVYSSDKNGSYRDNSPDLDLELTLWVNHVERNDTVPHQVPQLKSYHEAILGQPRIPAQGSASVALKKNQQETPVINRNEANSNRLTSTNGEAKICPPIGTYQENSSGSLPKPSRENQERDSVVEGRKNSFYIKVNMDGMGIGRKVDLNAYQSYESLALDLEKMFQPTSQNFVLAFQDSKGDCELVLDVPWEMFLHRAKRLRIIKSFTAHGFASKCSRKRKAT